MKNWFRSMLAMLLAITMLLGVLASCDDTESVESSDVEASVEESTENSEASKSETSKDDGAEGDAVKAAVGLDYRCAEFRLKRACAFGGRVNKIVVDFVAVEMQTSELFKIRTEKRFARPAWSGYANYSHILPLLPELNNISALYYYT